MTESSLAEDYDPNAPLAFDCPRCHHATEEAFYGPCRNCRRELTAQLGGERRKIVTTDYEPKMNVVPNQIATKE